MSKKDKNEREEVEEVEESEARLAFKRLIALYKKQNPVKAKFKNAEFERKLAAIK